MIPVWTNPYYNGCKIIICIFKLNRLQLLATLPDPLGASLLHFRSTTVQWFEYKTRIIKSGTASRKKKKLYLSHALKTG